MLRSIEIRFDTLSLAMERVMKWLMTYSFLSDISRYEMVDNLLFSIGSFNLLKSLESIIVNDSFRDEAVKRGSS